MTQREGGSHLLYVDPDPVYRQKVASVFEPEWTVTTADSAAEGVAEIDGSLDCVVATDEFPEATGLDFFDSVRSEADDIPFVLFTATEDLNLLRRAFRAGITDVIFKQSSGATAGSVGGGDKTECAVDRGDGIGGLQNCLDAVETEPPTLDGVTLDVSRSLMGAAADEVDMKTEWALQSLAGEIDATQCLIYEVDDEMETLELLHGWRDDEIADTETHSLLFDIGSKTIPADQFPGFGSQLQQFEAACIDATQIDRRCPTDDSHSASTEKDGGVGAVETLDTEIPELEPTADIGTLLALPVVIEWQLSAVILITVDQPREWNEDARQQLQSVGELVGHMERRRRQRQELERQNEQLEQFASVISHDLQNPLNVISGYLELAMETGNLDRLEPAADAADRMEEMLDDLLTLAREGQAVGETKEVELEPIVSEAWESVETYDGSLDLVDLDEFDSIEADESRLQEAFENLFKNAIVHAGEDVEMRVETDDGAVKVSDDGPGIPPDKRDVIFEYGHTGGNGTGLGLAIVRSIIEGHGWEISAAESEEGGARFDIELDR